MNSQLKDLNPAEALGYEHIISVIRYAHAVVPQSLKLVENLKKAIPQNTNTLGDRSTQLTDIWLFVFLLLSTLIPALIDQ